MEELKEQTRLKLAPDLEDLKTDYKRIRHDLEQDLRASLCPPMSDSPLKEENPEPNTEHNTPKNEKDVYLTATEFIHMGELADIPVLALTSVPLFGTDRSPRKFLSYGNAEKLESMIDDMQKFIDDWKSGKPENPATPQTDTRSYNVGRSNYSQLATQPWTVWLDWELNPWDADIAKRIGRTKAEPGMTLMESRRLDYEKIIHICQERIRQIDEGIEIKVEVIRHKH